MVRLTWLRAAPAVLLVLAPPPAHGQRAKNVALVIANGTYRAPDMPSLDAPANDATLVAEALGGAGYTVRIERDLSRTGMARALARFGRRARGATRALVYFAGHSVAAAGHSWIVPVDYAAPAGAELSKGGTRGLVPAADLVAAVRRARRAWVVIDGMGVRDESLAQSRRRGIAIGGCEGTLALDAHLPEEGSPMHGIFSYAFAEQLRSTALDGGMLMQAVSRQVAQLTSGRQTICTWGADMTLRAAIPGSLARRP